MQFNPKQLLHFLSLQLFLFTIVNPGKQIVYFKLDPTIKRRKGTFTRILGCHCPWRRKRTQERTQGLTTDGADIN